MKQLLALLFLIPFIGFGQTISPTQYFDSTYDVTNENMIPGYDSSLILSGAIHSSPPSLYIHKVDLDGNLIVEKSIEAYTADMLFPSKLIGTKDSSYITVNTIIQSTFNKLVLNKWDQNLDTVWQKIYGFNTDMKIGSIIEAFDSSLYVSFGDDQDLYVSKLNYFGDLIWTKKYSYLSNVNHSSICEMKDSNICIINSYNLSSFLTVIDTSGSEIITKRAFDIGLKEVICDKNGNLYAIGQMMGGIPIGVIKMNKDLDYLDGERIYFLTSVQNPGLKFHTDSTILVSGSHQLEQFNGRIELIDTSLNHISVNSFQGEFRSFCTKNNNIYFTEQGPLQGLKAQVSQIHYTISSFYDDSLACNDTMTTTGIGASATFIATSINVSNAVGQEIQIQLPIGTPSFGKDHSCVSFFGSIEENQSLHNPFSGLNC